MHSLRWLPRFAPLTVSLGLLLGAPNVALASDPAPPEPSGPPAPPEVRVHVTAEVAAKLQRLAPGETSWEDVCNAPCDLPQPLAGDYRVVDEHGKNPSNALQLVASQEPQQEAEVVYHERSVPGQVGGGAMLVVGIGGMALSAVMVVGGTVFVAGASSCSGGDNGYCGLGQAIGLLLMGVGAGVGLLGGLVTAGGFAALKASSASAGAKVVPVREPTWLGPRNGASARPAMTTPLTFSF